MNRPARTFLIAFLLLSGSAAQGSEISLLVQQLGDRDPDVREQATRALSAQGEAARDALRQASRDPNPAIAQAASSLLMRLPWTRDGDSQTIVKTLRNYGTLNVDQRAQRLMQLLNGKDEAARDEGVAVVLRIAQDEPVDEVLWRVLPAVTINASWKQALTKLDPSTVRTPVLDMIARMRLADGDETGYALLERVIQNETRWPTATADQISPAVQKLRERTDTRAAQIAAVAALRHMTTLRETPEMATNDAVALLILHAQHGPLPGLRQDLSLVNTDADVRPVLAVAQVARKIDAVVAATLLEQTAVRALTDATDLPNRAERLFYAGDLLQDLHRYESAVQLYEHLLVIAGPEDGIWVSNANLRLYSIYGGRREHLRAAQCLTDALNNLTGALITTRNGQSDTWKTEDAWTEVDWHYYKAAVAAGDEKGAAAQLRKIMTGAGTADGIYLEVLPELEKIAGPAEIDAYFERVYAASAARMAKMPEAPVAKNDLAWLCARSGRRLEEAVKLADEAVRAKPGEAAYLDTLAEAKFRVGDVDAAIQLETEALRIMPDNTFMKEQLERFQKARATTRPTK